MHLLEDLHGVRLPVVDEVRHVQQIWFHLRYWSLSWNVSNKSFAKYSFLSSSENARAWYDRKKSPSGLWCFYPSYISCNWEIRTTNWVLLITYITFNDNIFCSVSSKRDSSLPIGSSTNRCLMKEIRFSSLQNNNDLVWIIISQ